jgi:hypothetical protein
MIFTGLVGKANAAFHTVRITSRRTLFMSAKNGLM